MERTEKAELRDLIGARLDISRCRMSDEDALVLAEFINNYDSSYRGKRFTVESQFRGWGSDGSFIRDERWTHTLLDVIAVRIEYTYQDDDGQRGGSTEEIRDGRGVLEWLKEYGHRLRAQ